MKYNNLFNYPEERRRVTYPYVFWDDAFTDEEIQKLIEYCEGEELEEGIVFGGLNENIRKSKIKFFDYGNIDLHWFFHRMNEVIRLINNRWYGFDLNGYGEFQYTTYDASRKEHYDFHTDMGFGELKSPENMYEPRKLSLTLTLNTPVIDFKGGDFEIQLGHKEPLVCPQQKGRILAFPSFLLHRVTPVLEGNRKSIVIWVTGPKWV